MISSTQGWAFQSSLSLEQMKGRLDATFETPWSLGDSHYLGDYLGGRLDENVVVRIYMVESGFVANLRYRSLDDDVIDANKQISNGERLLINRVLPMILAQNITPTEPLE